MHPWRDAHGRRSAFGVRVKRKLTHGGFEVLGNFYQDEDPEGLRHRYFNSHDREFEIAVDVTNLGAISVIVDDVAIMVPCKDRKMEGVHAAEWLQTTERIRRENEIRSQVPREVAHEALKRIRDLNEAAGLRATIATPVHSAEQIDHFEARHFKHFQYSEPPAGERSEILGESIEAIDIDDLLNVTTAIGEEGNADATRSETPDRPLPDLRTSNDWTMED